VRRDLSRAAKLKIANSDIYSDGYAEFVATFERVVGLPPLQHYLFIEGGAVAVQLSPDDLAQLDGLEAAGDRYVDMSDVERTTAPR